MFELFHTHFIERWNMIQMAPGPYIETVIVLGLLIWMAISWAYRAKISGKEAQIELQDRQIADYKEKLGGASPDEAKAKFDRLQEQVEQLRRNTTPRRLIGRQRDQFIKALRSSNPPVAIGVLYDISCGDCNRYATDIKDAIKVATRWRIGYEAVQQSPDQPACGLAIVVPNPLNLSEEARLLLAAFREIGLTIELVRGRPDDDNVLEVSVTARFEHAR